MSKAAERSTTKKERDRANKAPSTFVIALLDLSWKMAVSLMVPVFIGLWADGKFGTDGVAVIIGFAVGIVSSLIVIFINARKLSGGSLDV